MYVPFSPISNQNPNQVFPDSSPPSLKPSINLPLHLIGTVQRPPNRLAISSSIELSNFQSSSSKCVRNKFVVFNLLCLSQSSPVHGILV